MRSITFFLLSVAGAQGRGISLRESRPKDIVEHDHSIKPQQDRLSWVAPLAQVHNLDGRADNDRSPPSSCPACLPTALAQARSDLIRGEDALYPPTATCPGVCTPTTLVRVPRQIIGQTVSARQSVPTPSPPPQARPEESVLWPFIPPVITRLPGGAGGRRPSGVASIEHEDPTPSSPIGLSILPWPPIAVPTTIFGQRPCATRVPRPSGIDIKPKDPTPNISMPPRKSFSKVTSMPFELSTDSEQGPEVWVCDIIVNVDDWSVYHVGQCRRVGSFDEPSDELGDELDDGWDDGWDYDPGRWDDGWDDRDYVYPWDGETDEDSDGYGRGQHNRRVVHGV